MLITWLLIIISFVLLITALVFVVHSFRFGSQDKEKTEIEE
ncbi:MAG: hypothetical protein ACOCU8_02160 [Patescibacteria group bacterium]